jgi:hypothetical protein
MSPYRPRKPGTSQSAVCSGKVLVRFKRAPPIRPPNAANQGTLVCLVSLTIVRIWSNQMEVETFICVFLITQQPTRRSMLWGVWERGVGLVITLLVVSRKWVRDAPRSILCCLPSFHPYLVFCIPQLKEGFFPQLTLTSPRHAF